MSEDEMDDLLTDRIRLEFIMRIYGLSRDSIDQMLARGNGSMRAKREKANISLRELAREMQCHESYLSRVERGEVIVTTKMKERFNSALKRLKAKLC